MSLVSIVLPAYNEENEILSALHDLDSQTYQDKEIIVVDDGSTDSTASLAESFAARNDHTKVIRAKHAGPSAARNLGIKFSSGDVIFFGECDCSYDSRYVERAMNALRANPEAGAVCLTGAPLKVRSNRFMLGCIGGMCYIRRGDLTNRCFRQKIETCFSG